MPTDPPQPFEPPAPAPVIDDPLAGLDRLPESAWMPRTEHRLCVVCERFAPHQADTVGCTDCREPRGRCSRIAALRGTCGCDDCIAGAVELQEVRRDRWAGATLKECGDRLGVTRERARQLLRDLFDDDYGAFDREQEALEQEARAVALADATCRTCGGRLPSPGRAFCTVLCRHVWDVLRLHVDDERWEAHQRANAKAQGRNRWADVGERGSRAGARYLLPGSVTWHAARLVVVNGWPLADRFADGIIENSVLPHLADEPVGAAT